MWDFRRKGWTFRSGGEARRAERSGLFKSTDGGATWTELDEKSAKGLPAKPWGRIAVAVAPSKPQRRLRAGRSVAEERPLPLRRRRRDLAGARSQPVHGLAARSTSRT